jgi:hypothetical protein
VSANLNRGVSTFVIYLDIAKAFDKIPHDKLLNCLEHFGVSCQVTKWIRGFLCDRRQFVSLGNSKSREYSVNSGVPQGSVLGPLLFLMFFDAVKVEQPVQMFKFADDSKLMHTSHDDLQVQLDAVNSQIRESGLTVAPEKSSVISFSNVVAGINNEYTLGEAVIPVVSTQRDLGVTLDDRLKFSEHCQRIANSATALGFRILRSFSVREPKFLFHVFKIYVRPILERDSVVWSPYYKEDVLRVERPQRRFSKSLPGMSEYSYLRRLHILGEETLLVRRIKADLMLVYKIANGLIDGLDHLVTFQENVRTRGNSKRIKLLPFRVNARKSFFSVRVASYWNSLPDEAVNACSIGLFKAVLKTVRFHDENLKYFD